jgi:2-(1,2-epoxy-1,2-dihydrophenyl)acetyl-CoA isomerase
MIYKSYAVEDFNSEVASLAEKLSKMPTKALGLTKRLLNESLTNDLTAQLEMESKLQIEAAQSDDYAEGVNAFVEKRKPIFKGK